MTGDWAPTLVRCVGQTVLLGTGIAAASSAASRPARRGAFLLAWALLVPGAILALWPVTVGMAAGWRPGHAPHWRLVPAALPLGLAPLLGRMAAIEPGQRRAAVGLGAGRWQRLRFVWLPQLGPAAFAGLAGAVLLDVAALLLEP